MQRETMTKEACWEPRTATVARGESGTVEAMGRVRMWRHRGSDEQKFMSGAKAGIARHDGAHM